MEIAAILAPFATLISSEDRILIDYLSSGNDIAEDLVEEKESSCWRSSK